QRRRLARPRLRRRGARRRTRRGGRRLMPPSTRETERRPRPAGPAAAPRDRGERAARSRARPAPPARTAPRPRAPGAHPRRQRRMTGPARVRESPTPPAHRRGDGRPDVGADAFRRALAAHPAGVVVVTADSGGRPVGLTATSVTSVSLDPPLVAFYIAATSSTWPHLHAEDARDLAARFARRGGDRFAPPTEWTPGPGGTPLLGGAAAHLLCRSERTEEVGAHWLVVGRVRSADVHRPTRPLLYHQGG